MRRGILKLGEVHTFRRTFYVAEGAVSNGCIISQ